jgi:hypothetical protein
MKVLQAYKKGFSRLRRGSICGRTKSLVRRYEREEYEGERNRFFGALTRKKLGMKIFVLELRLVTICRRTKSVVRSYD